MTTLKKESPDKENTFYTLGQRDMIANLFMEIRMSNVDKTLQRWAEMLPDNPHIQDYLKNNPTH